MSVPGSASGSQQQRLRGASTATLTRLEREERAWNLHYIQGYGTKQIAEVTEVTERSVRRDLARVRARKVGEVRHDLASNEASALLRAILRDSQRVAMREALAGIVTAQRGTMVHAVYCNALSKANETFMKICQAAGLLASGDGAGDLGGIGIDLSRLSDAEIRLLSEVWNEFKARLLRDGRSGPPRLTAGEGDAADGGDTPGPD